MSDTGAKTAAILRRAAELAGDDFVPLSGPQWEGLVQAIVEALDPDTVQDQKSPHSADKAD